MSATPTIYMIRHGENLQTTASDSMRLGPGVLDAFLESSGVDQTTISDIFWLINLMTVSLSFQYWCHAEISCCGDCFSECIRYLLLTP
jgi:hypothetical protein